MNTEYYERILSKKIALVNELKALDTVYTFALDTNQSEDIDHCDIKMSNYPIVCSYNEYRKAYSFYLRTNKLKYISTHDLTEYRQNNKEPNGIGVLTKNKVIAWIEYLKKEYDFLEEMSKEKQKTVVDFIAKARTIDCMSITDEKREFGGHILSGRAIKNGISFSFEVDSNTGYIHKKIELHYSVDNTLEAFKTLSDNKYIK